MNSKGKKMRSLTIDLFTSSIEDKELSEYKVLAVLKFYRKQLRKNLLYPTFSELIEIFNMLSSLRNQKSGFKRTLPGHYNDYQQKRPEAFNEYDTDYIDEYNILNIFRFIDWSMPRIKELLNEGIAIFDFVESQIEINEFGDFPFYKDDGYFLARDGNQNIMHVFKYVLSRVPGSDVPFKSFKTSLIDSISDGKGAIKSEHDKINLVQKCADVKLPAMFEIKSEIDLPFHETILPVAKRILINKITEQ